MKKKGAIIVSLILISILLFTIAFSGFVSASWLSDLIGKLFGNSGVTGNVIADTTNLVPVNWTGIGSGNGFTIKASADLNNDGRDEVILQNEAKAIGYWTLNASGYPVVWKAMSESIASNWGTMNLMLAGKINNQNVMMFEDSAGNIGYWTLNSSTNPILWTNLTPVSGWYIAAITGNSSISKVYLQSTSGIGYWDMNTSNGKPAYWKQIYNASSYRIVAAADINKDGIKDIILQDSVGSVGYWIIDSSGLPASWKVINTSSIAGWTVGAAAGDAENTFIFLQKMSDATIGYWTMGFKNSPLTCTSFTYSDWNTCNSSGFQTRTLVSSLPSGCVGGSPILTQSCLNQETSFIWKQTDGENCSGFAVFDGTSYYLLRPSMKYDSDASRNITSIKDFKTDNYICEDVTAGSYCFIGNVNIRINQVAFSNSNPNDRYVNLTLVSGNISNTCVSNIMGLSCSDSDGGIDYFTQGTITLINYSSDPINPLVTNFQDSCSELPPEPKNLTSKNNSNSSDLTSGVLQEYFCNQDGSVNYTYSDCLYGCTSGYCIEPLVNLKNISRYYPREVFLMSDKDWKDVLPWVSTIIWTSNSSVELQNCTKPYNGAENVCAYPFLVYYKDYHNYTKKYEKLQNIDEIYNSYNSGFYNDTLVYINQQGIISYNIYTKEKKVIYPNSNIYAIKITNQSIIFTYPDYGTEKLIIMSYNRQNGLVKNIYNTSFNNWIDPAMVSDDYIYINEWTGTITTDYSSRSIYNLSYYDLNLKTKHELANNVISPEGGIISGKYIIWREISSNNWYLNIHDIELNKTERYSLSNYAYDFEMIGDKIFFLRLAKVYYFDLIDKKENLLETSRSQITFFDIHQNKMAYVYEDGSQQIILKDLDTGEETQVTEDADAQYYNPKVFGDNIIFYGYNPDADYKNSFYIFNSNITPSFFEINSFDVDSALTFIQQYQDGNEKITIVGNTSQELDDLLIASPPLGAGMLQKNIKRISSDKYLTYWKSYENVVYVEDNYELALLASTYASLINAPLIIKGSALDKSEFFSGRNVTCIGNVIPPGNSCNEQYNLEQLQEKYINLTETNKIILTNPSDLGIILHNKLQPQKSVNPVTSLYTKTSILSSILASAKHEILLTVSSTNYTVIDNYLKLKLTSVIGNIINYYCTIGDSCSSGAETNQILLYAKENQMDFKLNIKFLPDLDIQREGYNGDLNFMDQYALVNQQKNISFRIINYGNSIARDARIYVYSVNYECNEDYCYETYDLIDSKFIGDVPQNTIIYENFSLIVNNLGWHNFKVTINSSDEEESMFNNENYFPIIGVEPGPQLIFGNSYYEYKNYVNEPVNLSANIVNIGTEQANNVVVSLYEYNGGYEDDNGNWVENISLIGDASLGNLGPMSSKIASFMKSFDSAGYKTLRFIVNSSDAMYPSGYSYWIGLRIIDPSEDLQKNSEGIKSIGSLDYNEEMLYDLYLPVALFDCEDNTEDLDVYFNDELVKTFEILCKKRSEIFNSNSAIYISDISYSGNVESLNITLKYKGNLSFNKESNLYIYRNSSHFASCNFGDSCMPNLNDVLIENKIARGASEYNFNALSSDKNYLAYIKIISPSLENASIYFNGNKIRDISNVYFGDGSEIKIPITKEMIMNTNTIKIVPEFWYWADEDNAVYSAEVKFSNDMSDNSLTILAAPNAIPYKEFTENIDGYDQYKPLDQAEYADMSEDSYPDLAVGRIQGMTSSDVSSYLARDLFYDKLSPSNNIKFMASSFDFAINLANDWTNLFNEAGYNAINVTSIETAPPFPSSEWINQTMISYQDHGNEQWAGISSSEMPELTNSLVFNDACSTCASYDSYSFCNTAIRKGAIAHLGAVCVAWTGNNIYMNTMNGIYYYNQTLGRAFVHGYDTNTYKRMTTLFGDPTFKLNNINLLNEPLKFNY